MTEQGPEEGKYDSFRVSNDKTATFSDLCVSHDSFLWVYYCSVHVALQQLSKTRSDTEREREREREREED